MSLRTAFIRTSRSSSLGNFPISGPSASSSITIAQFHSSSIQNAVAPSVQKKEKQRLLKKRAEQKQELQRRILELTKPDPVLGHQMNSKGDQVWQDSELRKIILSKDIVWGVREDRRGNLIEVSDEEGISSSSEGQVGPKRINFGLDTKEDRQLLFENLPAVIIEDQLRSAEDQLDGANQTELLQLNETMQNEEEIERGHSDLLARMLDLKNANGKGIQVENIRRIVQHFGGGGNGESGKIDKNGKEQGLDTGSPEVQAAVLTYRIRNLHEHLESSRHDNANRRGMTALVQQRAKVLKYLKRKSVSRYNAILPRIGVEPRAVEGEVTVPGKPLMKASF